VQQLDQFSFHPYLSSSTGTALVMFTARGCGACRHLRQVLREVAARRTDWHLLAVDAQQDMALVREFEVFHLPTLFLFRDGEFHCELRAEARTEAILAAVSAALRLPAQETP
jgi:thioredoxin-like negative regulator of GroEL